MATPAHVRVSKRMSYLLRHSDELCMDREGWASIDDLLSHLKGVSRSVLQEVVDTNNKKRFEIQGERIRACQGHSARTVQSSDLESTWEVVDTTNMALYHGTKRTNVDSILATGLNAATRTHVHLAESADSKVGKRANVDVLLKIDGNVLRAHGIEVYRASNGVLLASSVPPDAIQVYSQSPSRLGGARARS